MASRAILLVALAAFLFPPIACADNAPTFPSRKASVVIPLLKAFSPKDGYARIVKILGKEDVDAGNAIKDCFYRLDDGTSIRVRASGDTVLSIWREAWGPNGIQIIYGLSKMWET